MAVLSILLAALAPSISFARGSAHGTSMIEVCTAQGSQWIAADMPADEAPVSKGWSRGHCLLCCGHGVTLGMPPADERATLILAFNHVMRDAPLEAPRTLPVWLAAQARAPPLAQR